MACTLGGYEGCFVIYPPPWDVQHCMGLILDSFSTLRRKISARLLSSVMVSLSFIAIILLSYCVYIALIRRLAAAISSLFGAIFGLILFWGICFTVFEI